ncbi:aminotriazole resistance protein [Fusarium subglutinans]|uniref:Aminotriazole resistance protein n=1 Tax=Gibberella subglutinans TaxID=42677 RepID=A0A8H5PSU6_GIBSU|nr:aminotriazole resistance protein [Fusarium subglutinans]KAF5602382.1 aminotriazole resistance protein [Fusarium subglutinans]
MKTRSGTDTHEDNATSRGHKRQSSKTDSAPEPKTKQAKTTDARPSTPDGQKPTLTEKDLEFDFDHSQIRDPRATPGRVKRPRYEERELGEDFLSKFHIPKHRNKHTDPLYSFYDLHRCHLDEASGLQQEINGQWHGAALKRVEDETKKIYDSFFIDGKGPEGEMGSTQVMDQIKDQVSKDLGVPWHQIDPKQLKKWEDQGFAKVDADKWWHRPNQVERDRFMKMLGGASPEGSIAVKWAQMLECLISRSYGLIKYNVEIFGIEETMATQTQTLLEDVLPSTAEAQSYVDSPPNAVASSSTPAASRLQKIAVTFQLSGVNFAASATNGLIVVGLPQMTADLSLPPSLAFWPSSVQGLATASTLLLAGALADVLGARSVDLLGCILSGSLMLACGFVRAGEQLVALRALQGVALALHLSSSVALVTRTLARGRGRNLAFACLGLSQPLGFSFGLVLGGVLVETIGWRSGWFLYGGINLVLSAVGFWSLPKSEPLGTLQDVIQSVATKIDWLGTLLASAFMALLSYFLAIISTDVYRIKDASSIVLLSLSLVALPLFVGWMHLQVKRGLPALIPNAFWRNHSFTTICVTIALSNAVINSLELFASLFFQEVQHLSALNAALRILPSVVVGIALNFTTGLVVHRIPAIWLVVITSVLTAISPLLMALIDPAWTYWTAAFFAQVLMPFSADVLFTVGLIVVTETFSEDKQAVAGSVFNAASQFGNAMGLAVMQVISTLVSKQHAGSKPAEALLQGYKASFWAMFSFMVLCALIGGVGLRKAGKVGLKQE